MESTGGVIPAALLTLPVIILALILKSRRKKRVKNFSAPSSDSQFYTCPVCSMTNDSMKPCERCGFDPLTKTGAENYNDLFPVDKQSDDTNAN